MRKKRPPRLIRPADALMPIAALIALPFTNYLAFISFAVPLAGITLLSLASCRGLRAAFATQPSIRSVRGGVKAALLLQLGGTALFCAGWRAFDPTLDLQQLALAGAALAFNIEHTFYEYLYATGDGRSAVMSRILSSALVAAGIILYSSHDGDPLWLFGACAIAAGASSVIALAIGGPLNGPLNGQVLRCAPRALLQIFLYPLAGAAICHLVARFSPELPFSLIPFFVGLALYEVCRTPFRRSQQESRALDRLLIGAAGVGAMCIAASFTPFARYAFRGDVLMTGAMLIAAALCAFALYSSLGEREE